MVRQFGWMCLALSLLFVANNSCQAQLRIGQQLPQRVFRALGHGSGPGHHHCNPGPDVSYYNSWSQKNSFLISQSPEYMSRFGHEPERSPMRLLYSGSSPYAHGAATTSVYGHAVPMNADFVPSTQLRADAEDDQKDEDRKIEPPSSLDSDSQEADEFEKEADAMAEEFGGFGSFEDDEIGSPDNKPVVKPGDEPKSSASTDEGDAVWQSPPSVFLPTSSPIYGSGK